MLKNSIYSKIRISYKLDDFFFPVGKHNLYFDKDTYDDKAKMQPFAPCFPQYARKFKAVVDEEYWNMLECVSNSYTLLTNKWACDQVRWIGQQMFHVGENEIRFYKGELTEDRGACSIDFLIYKQINISGVANTWHSFLHIENSYNRTSPLCYKIGFFLEEMEGKRIPIGILIPSLSLDFSANHGWQLKTIERRLEEAVYDQYRARDVFSDFEQMVRELLDIEVVDDEILPLFCKLANMKKLDEESQSEINLAHVLIKIDKVAKTWIEKCGCNAYAALCAYADFASDYAEGMKSLFKQPSEYQSLLGKLLDDLIDAKHRNGTNFSLDKYIGETGRAVSKQIKLICSSNARGKFHPSK